MFLAPTQVIAIWPWMLTPLTCRVVGAIFFLGSAGIGVLVDPRWSSVKLMLQVETLMVTLMLIAALRAHAAAGRMARTSPRQVWCIDDRRYLRQIR
jgi:hypothetical protein